jgi:stage III sporulation protein SpoIIIAA
MLQEVAAARTIAERGVLLVATAHGNTLQNVLRNPELRPLLGNVQPVILGDKIASTTNKGRKVRRGSSLCRITV